MRLYDLLCESEINLFPKLFPCINLLLCVLAIKPVILSSQQCVCVCACVCAGHVSRVIWKANVSRPSDRRQDNMDAAVGPEDDAKHSMLCVFLICCVSLTVEL